MVARVPRFWVFYAVAWVPYWAIVLLAFLTSGDLPFAAAVPASLINVVPSAALGVAVIRLCRRLEWTPERPVRFFSIQLGLATAYAALAVFTESGLFVAHDSIRRGHLSLEMFNPGIALWQLLMAALVYCVLASVTYTLGILSQLRREEERVVRAKALQTEAELKALRAQLNPHFLFNTLHTLLALVRKDPGRAEEALEQFGDLLRYALRVQKETIDEGTLAAEWKFVTDYLSLEKLRLGERLRLDVDVESEALECIVPVFCLQPLVENAIRHGIAPRAGGGEVAIRARVLDGRLLLRVQDDGRGAAGAATDERNGMGLRLVRERIDSLYDGQADLVIETRPAVEGFAVRVSLPVRREPALEEGRS